MYKKIIAIFVVLIAVFFAIDFYFKPQLVKILDDSMLPNFKEGQIVEIHPNYEKLQIGDVIVYKTTSNTVTKDTARAQDMHRIVAVAGDTISYDSAKEGLFRVKGITLSTQNIGNYYSDNKGDDYSVIKITNQNQISYTVMQKKSGKHYLFGWAQTYRKEFPNTNGDMCNFVGASFSCFVPKGYVFVAGDNLDNTLFGLVPVENVMGIVTPY
jgi:signal peptidase I